MSDFEFDAMRNEQSEVELTAGESAPRGAKRAWRTPAVITSTLADHTGGLKTSKHPTDHHGGATTSFGPTS